MKMWHFGSKCFNSLPKLPSLLSETRKMSIATPLATNSILQTWPQNVKLPWQMSSLQTVIELDTFSMRLHTREAKELCMKYLCFPWTCFKAWTSLPIESTQCLRNLAKLWKNQETELEKEQEKAKILERYLLKSNVWSQGTNVKQEVNWSILMKLGHRRRINQLQFRPW